MWADPAVVRFIGAKPSTAQQTWSRLLTYLGLWQALNFGYWAIEKRDSGEFIGEIGFADFKRDIVPAMQNVPELGFALVSSKHGKGYAREAVRAVLGWGDRHLPSARTVALTNEENAASRRVLEASGYHLFDRAAFNGSPVHFFERYCARQSAATETTV